MHVFRDGRSQSSSVSEDLLAVGVLCGDVASQRREPADAFETESACLVESLLSVIADTGQALSDARSRIFRLEDNIFASRSSLSRNESVVSIFIAKLQKFVRAAIYDDSPARISGISSPFFVRAQEFPSP